MRLTEEELAVALREERTEIDPGFAAALDEWAAAGFPRAQRPDATPRRSALWDRLRVTPPRRVIAPAGAFATLVVVAGIAISQSGGPGGGQSLTVEGEQPASQAGPPEESTHGNARFPELLPNENVPSVKDAAPGAAAADSLSRRSGAAQTNELPLLSGGRKVAQNVDLTLASEPEKVREVADGVNEVVNRYHGFVVASSVDTGDAKRGLGAHFELRVPARNLQAALADLSELAHVQSRTEGTLDVTERFTSAQDRIDELQTVRRNLLERIENATTEAQIDALRAQLHNVNAQLNAARTDLAQARQRVQLVPVNVSIVAEEGADSNGDWSIGDAIDDAGDVLSTAAGVAVVAGAVLLPLALVALLVGLAARAWIGRSRERALGE